MLSLIGKEITFLCERAYDIPARNEFSSHTCYVDLKRSKHKGIIEDIIVTNKKENQPRVLVKMPFSKRYHRLDNIFQFISELPKNFKVSQSNIIEGQKSITEFIQNNVQDNGKNVVEFVDVYYGEKWTNIAVDDIDFIDSFDSKKDYIVNITDINSDGIGEIGIRNIWKFKSKKIQDELLKKYEISKIRIPTGKDNKVEDKVENNEDLSYWKQYEEYWDGEISEKITDITEIKDWMNSIIPDFNDNSDEDISEETIKNIEKTAKQFFNKYGYITAHIINAMVSQL
jgi:hypothetical protein